MKHLLGLLVGLLLAGCGPRLYPIEMESAKDFSVYRNLYAEIKHETLGQGVAQFPIVFGHLTKTKDVVQYGVCVIEGPMRWIVIDSVVWSSMTEESRKELIFHEMIHCDLDFLTHVGLSGNIMNSMHQFLPSPEASLAGFFEEYSQGLHND